MSTLLQDLRYARRMLVGNPSFGAVAIISLALGIAANTAVFSLIDAILLRPLPVREPGRLVELWTVNADDARRIFSYPMFEEICTGQQVFSRITAWGSPVLILETGGQSVVGGVTTVTPDYFAALGVSPLIGRFPGPRDTSTAVAVISYRFWQEHYGGASVVLGETLTVHGRTYTIIGVVPKDFSGLMVGMSADVWVPLGSPLATPADLQNRSFQDFWITARLRDAVTIDQARAQLEALWPSILEATVPEHTTLEQRKAFLTQRIELASAGKGILSLPLSEFRQPLWVLMGAVGVVLVVACVNLANLLLGRAVVREHEMGIRIALGASRWRLSRQLLTESLLLSAAGAVVGLPLAYCTSRFLASFVWTGVVPLNLDLSPDARVLAFTSAIAVLTGVLFGLAPVRNTAREGPARLLQQNPRTLGRSGRGRKFSKLLVASQVTLSLVLLDGAALFTRSLTKLRSIDPGLRSEGVLGIFLQPRPGGYNNLARASYYRRLMNELRSLPSVRSVGLSNLAPIEPFEVKQRVSTNPIDNLSGGPVEADALVVSPYFFNTLGMSLLKGRDFDFQDDERGARVVIISRSLAQHLSPSSDVLGRHINVGADPDDQNLRIVGVVSDANLYNIRNQKPPAVYLPFFQKSAALAPYVQVRTELRPQAIATAARQRIEALGREYVFGAETLVEQVNRSLGRERVLAMLSKGFAGLAILLASIGLYGLMSYSVMQRAGEIGIRMALGADGRRVLMMILKEAFLLALAGVAFGIPGALAGAHLISNQLYGLSATDPFAIVVATILLLAIVGFSGYIPARRAAKVDPMVALRSE